MSSACKDTAISYKANVRRVHSLGLIPGHAFLDGEGWKDACNKTQSEMPGVDPDSEAFSSRAGKIFNAWWKASDQPEKERNFKEATANADAMWSKTPLMNEALHGLLQTMVNQAWSAFEYLAEDLYKALINERASLQFTPRERNDFHLGFISRKRIRNTYKFLFKTDNAKVVSTLDSKTIDALALVRNVLVHKAGIIDKVFFDDSKDVPVLVPLRALGEGKEILLTGKRVRDLIDPAIPVGFELLNSVDDWLFSHP